jgi:ring-1,2-phenylacetyl-CoA epoxidase subunit PaaB
MASSQGKPSPTSDTQWPRYQVFHQDQPGRPHLDAGTVHAPDSELALLIARDVFVRRPHCVSLWVVPADQITSETAETLAEGQATVESGGERLAEPYWLFVKSQARGAHEHLGEVQAASPVEALRLARELHPDGWGYWVCPRRSLVTSDPQEQSSFFEPALDKPYRDQAFYSTDSLLREARRSARQEPKRA